MPGELAEARPSIDGRDGAVVAINRGRFPLEDSERLRAALVYAGRGWAVFPLHTPTETGCSCRQPDCHDVGKHPRTLHGLKDATTNENVIRQWWQTWPEANIGINTGMSGLVVVDVDPRHGGDESVYDMKSKHGEDWTETATVKTGGNGTHYYYSAIAQPVRNSSDILPGIDIRGDGGYVVAPPSLHESGHTYDWEVTVGAAPLIDYPVELFPRKASSTRTFTGTNGGVIPSGARNEELTSMAGTMRRRGMGYASILAALKEENAERCDPPLPATEVEKIARSVARYEPGNDVVLPSKTGGPTYSNLRKHTVEPPIWVLRIHETDVVLGVDALSTHAALRKRALAMADVVLDRMKTDEWDDQLRVLMADMQIIDAPLDASEGGVAWDAIRTLLGQRSDNEERYAQGRPIERDGMVYFNGSMAKQALKQQGITLDQRMVWELVRAHGGQINKNTRINGSVIRAWIVPTEAIA